MIATEQHQQPYKDMSTHAQNNTTDCFRFCRKFASGIEYRNKTDMLISNRCLSLNPDVYQTSF